MRYRFKTKAEIIDEYDEYWFDMCVKHSSFFNLLGTVINNDDIYLFPVRRRKRIRRPNTVIYFDDLNNTTPFNNKGEIIREFYINNTSNIFHNAPQILIPLEVIIKINITYNFKQLKYE